MINNKTKGFLLGAIAAASYGMNPLFTLPLYSAGMSVDSVLFYRYALAIVVPVSYTHLLSERRSLIPNISSNIKLEEIVTSNTPIGSLSSYVPGFAVKLYHLPSR